MMSKLTRWLNKHLFLILIFLYSSAIGQIEKIRSNFSNPPAEYSLVPFWSWNGKLEADKLKWQMDQMKEKGIDGAFIHARAGLTESETPYLSDAFWVAMDTSVTHAKRIGFQTYLYDEDKWPSGSAGGRTIAVNPEEFTKKGLYYDFMEVIGEQQINLNFSGDVVSVFAGKLKHDGILITSSLIDITNKNGTVWNVPNGKWLIVAFSLHLDQTGQIDYMDMDAVRTFLDLTHEEYYKRFGNEFGRTIPGIFFDEIYLNPHQRIRTLIWTDDFLEQFLTLKGYDLKPFLPLLSFDGDEETSKIRSDYFDVVSELYTNAWFRQYADWAEDHSIWVTGHTGERFDSFFKQGDYFKTMGQLQIPTADNEDFRYGFPRLINWYAPKQMSSIAHNYGRTRVGSEAMGGGGYGISLAEYKYGLGMLASYGINFFIPHLFHYEVNTPETQEDAPPSWFYRNPYWKYFKPLADYGKRLSYVLSQGHHVSDVALLHPLSAQWADGNERRIQETDFMNIQQNLLDNLIDYDIIDPNSLSKSDVSDGLISIFDANYKVLLLPAIPVLSLEEAEKIYEFYKNGGIVVALDPLPSKSMHGGTNDGRVKEIIKKVFGYDPSQIQKRYFRVDDNFKHFYRTHKNVNGGIGIFTQYLNEIQRILEIVVNDGFDILSGDKIALSFNRRKLKDAEIFYFMNELDEMKSWVIEFDGVRYIEKWDLYTGEISEENNWLTGANGNQCLVLSLKGHESKVFTFIDGSIKSKTEVIKESNLLHPKMTMQESAKTVTGWSKSKDSISVELLTGNLEKEKIKIPAENDLKSLEIEGKWNFQLVPEELDYKWNNNVSHQIVELPLMKFAWNHENLNSSLRDEINTLLWKEIKIEDLYNKKEGVQRYLSDWNAKWITYYQTQLHRRNLGGGSKLFKKSIEFEKPISNAKIFITADESYELMINGEFIGKDNNWKTVERYELDGARFQSETEIIVKVKNTNGLLFEADFELTDGEIVKVISDNSWLAVGDGSVVENAFEYSSPPLGRWGKIAKTDSKISFPLIANYKQFLPPGAFALKKPNIIGEYNIYINNQLLEFNPNEDSLNFQHLLSEKENEIEISVEIFDENYGLIKPLQIFCTSIETELTDWQNLNIGWYSGRGLYSKSIIVPNNYLGEDQKLILDLGEVNHFAEIWINGKLASYHSWGPFESDITNFLIEGQNNITVVVANLIINEAQWNILDDNYDSRAARWWLDGTISREKNKLKSGLIGPVNLIPLKKVSVKIE